MSGETVGVMDTGLRQATVDKKVADMTAEEKHTYYWSNKKDWKQLQNNNNAGLSPKPGASQDEERVMLMLLCPPAHQSAA